MPPRASWKGFLRISLVTCPIALFPATSSTGRISFHRINRATGARVRQLNVDARTGEKVESEDIVRGYEIDKDRYVTVEDEEIEAIQVEASKVIDVTQFVDAGEVEPFFLDSPYYLAPEGEVGEETYRVIRAALEETGTAGIGSIVLASRQRRVLLAPKGRGIAMSTLRTTREVRSAESYFEGVRDEPVDAELVEAAKMLIGRKRQPFEPTELVDQYEEALRDLVRAKAKGETPVYAPAPQPRAVIDLMAALKQSLETEGGERKPTARRPRAKAEPEKKPKGRKRA
jgi:DNA end-binding protein Ku